MIVQVTECAGFEELELCFAKPRYTNHGYYGSIFEYDFLYYHGVKIL